MRPDVQTWTPYLALSGGGPVGVVAVASEDDHAHLRHFAIDYRRQGQGLGREMLDAVISAVSRSSPSCRYLQLTTHPENEAALSLYQSAGFRQTGTFSGIEPVLRFDLDDPRRSAS